MGKCDTFHGAVKDKGGVPKVAVLIGCTRAHVYNLFVTRTMPAVDLAHRIQSLIGCPIEWWDSKARTTYVNKHKRDKERMVTNQADESGPTKESV